MNENPDTEVTPIEEPSSSPQASETGNSELPESGTDKPSQEEPEQPQTGYKDQLQKIIDTLHQDDQHKTLVELPNGTSFVLVSKVTVGEALIASAVFLLLSFQVLKWLLNHVWRR
ncbi:hypothetical protein PbDSM24746_62880 [Paenibacillus macerans]|uniref:hypothetical protein n=1 Tax=Paenibacillus macerans TaxID=44252 RepID=UPI000EC1BC1E|nr:hypothetical protein [Paenibacillus macerans]GBK66284.1 hypothetical protein PbDSM24746_62880 [Paenibacillus macerans]